MKKYIKVWLKTALLSLQNSLVSPGASLMFILGKFVRFFFYIIALTAVFGEKKTVGGYDLNTIINFYLIYNLLDSFGQIFFRGIYWFRNKVVSGRFDLDLVKPVNPLFQALTHHTDILDIPLFFVVIGMLMWRNWGISIASFFVFILTTILGFLIITAIHILVASLGVLTTEVDHAIWVYRDLSTLARVPVDIYNSKVRFVLTYILPIAVIFTFPAKSLMGILQPRYIIISTIISFLFFTGSLVIWKKSLRSYSSASS